MSVEVLSTAYDTSAPPRWRRGEIGRHLLTPLVLATAVGALYVWVSGQSLDSIEARVLDAGFLRTATVQHLKLTAVATGFVLLIAVPLGVALTRPGARWLTPWVMSAANVGQAAPALGVLVLLVVLFGIGFEIAVIALVAHAVLPVLRNTIVGIQQVDTNLVEAARGMGMNRWQVLRTVELPLAVPVMLAGLRTTIVICVGVATVATFVNAGGLGDVIVAGIKLQRTPILVTGGVLTAVIALGLDWLAGVAENVLRPRGI